MLYPLKVPLNTWQGFTDYNHLLCTEIHTFWAVIAVYLLYSNSCYGHVVRNNGFVSYCFLKLYTPKSTDSSQYCLHTTSIELEKCRNNSTFSVSLVPIQNHPCNLTQPFWNNLSTHLQHCLYRDNFMPLFYHLRTREYHTKLHACLFFNITSNY